MGDLRFLPAGGRQPRALAILLHGVGADPGSMVPLARGMIGVMPDLAIVIPQAPFPFDLGSTGFQWFSVQGVTQANRDGRIQAALPHVLTIVSRESARHSLPLSKVGAAGFSQGAMMALALADQPAAPAAIVSIAGRIARAPDFAPSSPPRIFLTHGNADAIVPFECLYEAATAYKAADYDVSVLSVQAQGHQIGLAQSEAVASFFTKSFNMELAEASL